MPSTFLEHVLPNGLRVVCESMPRVRSAAVGFLARTGSRHEADDEHGVSHFLEHMCFKGTAQRDWRDINVRFDELGSIYNAYTGKEHTVYFGWVPSERGGPQLELLADMMRPSLPPDDFETERKVILEEIAMSGDSFEHHVWNFLHETCFPRHPLAHEILGEKETIASLPRERMAAYHARRYAPDNLVLLASGAVDADAFIAAAGRYCGEWRPHRNGPEGSGDGLKTRPTNAWKLPSGVRKHQLPQFKQQSLVLVFPSVPSTDPAGESIETFQALFGGVNSRCYWNIVQKGVCSQAGAAWISYADCGLMALYADGDPEKCEQMLAALREQARDVAENGFDAAEVRRVVNRRRTQLALEAENPKTRLMQIVDDIDTRGHPMTAEARLAEVEAVTPRSIAAYLRRFPISGEGLLLSVGPRDWP